MWEVSGIAMYIHSRSLDLTKLIGVGNLLKGLGLAPPTANMNPMMPPKPKENLAFPSPLEFVRNAYSEDQQNQPK